MEVRNAKEEVSIEQKQLADVIKNTHIILRKETVIYGADEAWRRHLARSETLQCYAASMKELATQYWTKASTTREKARCRIDWILSEIQNYFTNSGNEKFLKREADILEKLEKKIESSKFIKFHEEIESTNKKLIKVLDVGSCYNPFQSAERLEVTAIDLAPSTESVLRCDFLSVNIGSELLIDSNSSVTQLPSDYFNVVVFSLFLEYLPCPSQRHACCEKAASVLQPNGILIIVTPDSKHIGANAKFMKSWRLALSKLGFMRISYEKLPHMHCLVYRKCIYRDVAYRWASLQTTLKDDQLFIEERKIFIPQDFQVYKNKETDCKETSAHNSEEISDSFNQLPFNYD